MRIHELPQYLEFLHSGNAIAGFMLILQNAFSGLLAAFVVVLIFVVLIVLGHGIGSSVEADYVNMGILKTIGFTGGKLRRIQLAQYMLVILTGMVFGYPGGCLRQPDCECGHTYDYRNPHSYRPACRLVFLNQWSAIPGIDRFYCI